MRYYNMPICGLWNVQNVRMRHGSIKNGPLYVLLDQSPMIWDHQIDFLAFTEKIHLTQLGGFRSIHLSAQEHKQQAAPSSWNRVLSFSINDSLCCKFILSIWEVLFCLWLRFQRKKSHSSGLHLNLHLCSTHALLSTFSKLGKYVKSF